MKLLFSFLLLVLAGNLWAQRYPEPLHPAYCEDRDLFSNYRTVLYRFTFSSECLSALNQSRMNRGRFCDREKLVRENGSIAHYFNFSSECQEGLREVLQSRYGLFCHNGNMLHIYRGTVTDLTFSSNCRVAINEAERFRGLFCNRGLLMNHYGQILRDYTFESNCRQALQRVTSGR